MIKLTAAVLLVGCASPGPDVLTARQIPTELQPDVAEVVASNNQFAADIYGQLAPASTNMVLSPFSISTAFAMLDAGSHGTTDSELRSAFRFTLDGDRLHTAYGALLTSLATGRDFGAYTLATANRLFGQDGFPFLQSFLDVTRTDYGAELLPVDFSSDPHGAVDTIDQWVSDQTDGKIPKLFQPDDLDGSILALVNAILFKGTWEQHFDHDRTAAATFTKLDGSTVSAQLMAKTDAVPQGPIPGGKIVLLPFDGKDLEMAILLPDSAAGLPALEAQLTGPALSSWIAGTSVETSDIVIPKFSLAASYSLPDALTALGVISAWDPATADLSGIDGSQDLFVNKAIHQAMIAVDEDGAVAAAATGIGVGDASLPETFRADHPFLFVIHDAVTNSVLFIGRVQDPTAM